MPRAVEFSSTHFKKTKAARRSASNGSQAFTLVELLIVLTVIALLASLLLYTLACAREKSRRANCVSNLRQLSVACHTYAADNKDYFFNGARDNHDYYTMSFSTPMFKILSNG